MSGGCGVLSQGDAEARYAAATDPLAGASLRNWSPWTPAMDWFFYVSNMQMPGRAG